ncbi:MAG: hypothetical protein KAH00_01000 [Cocleimonas sp.]|nr:hypothetical protein [Cocleimonas sp.]
MWNLVTELSLFFLIAAATGWLMGRYLCKSNELEERNEKHQYLKEKKLLRTRLTQHDEEYQTTITHLNVTEKKLVDADLLVTNLQARTLLLEKESERLNDQLVNNKKIKTELKELTTDHTHEQAQHHRYREKNISLTDERDNLIDIRNSLTEKLNASESLLQSLTFDLETNTTRNKAQQQQIVQLEDEVTEIRQQAKITQSRVSEKSERENERSLQRLAQERDKEVLRLQITKDQTVDKLKAENDIAIKKLEMTTNLSIQKLETTESDNREQHANFKLVDNENHTLKQRIEQQNKDYTLLQQKCTDLNEESLSFGRKLEKLSKAKNELRRSLEVITIENNDYLGRLRAISSVVDVVGTEPNRIISLNASSA